MISVYGDKILWGDWKEIMSFVYHVTFFHLNINYHFIWIYKVRKLPQNTVN